MRDSKFVSNSKGTPFRPRIPDNLRDEMRELTGHKPRQMNDLAIRYIEEGIERDKQLLEQLQNADVPNPTISAEGIKSE